MLELIDSEQICRNNKKLNETFKKFVDSFHRLEKTVMQSNLVFIKPKPKVDSKPNKSLKNKQNYNQILRHYLGDNIEKNFSK